jgi:hypothetical protein
MTFKKIFAGAVVAAAAGFSPAAYAELMALPAPNCGVGAGSNCLQFGDFSVYSLALLNFGATGVAANPNPGDPFYVKSAPGELLNPGYVVYGTGTNNAGVVANGIGMDDAFSTPNAIAGGTASFSTKNFNFFPGDPGAQCGGNPGQRNCDPTTTPGGLNPFVGDLRGSWDAQTSAIRGVLGGNQFAVFFNLNETGTDGLAGIDMLAWAKVTLGDNAGTEKVFFLAGQVPGDPTGKNLSVLNGAPDHTADPTAGFPGDPGVGDVNDPRWTYVHGTICARQAAPGVPQFLHFGPCVVGDPADAKNLNQNLGANQAAFAIYNAEISDAVMDPNSLWTQIHVEYVFGQENNGYEQLFSQSLNGVTQVPEPGTLASFAAALLGLAVAMRRRRRF